MSKILSAISSILLVIGNFAMAQKQNEKQLSKEIIKAESKDIKEAKGNAALNCGTGGLSKEKNK